MSQLPSQGGSLISGYVCHLRALWRRAGGQVEVLNTKSWRTLVPEFLHSAALQKRRPNCSIADETHGARGRGAAPAARPPDDPRRCHKPGSRSSNRTSQEPRVRSATPTGSCVRLGTQADPRHTAPCTASPSRSAGPAAPFLAGYPRRRGSRVRDPRSPVPEGRVPEADGPLRSAHLPISAAAPDVPVSPATPLRRLPGHSARAGSSRSPEPAGTAPPPPGLAARVANRRRRPTTERHWRRCLCLAPPGAPLSKKL